MRISFKDVSYSYNHATPFEVEALKNINLDLLENNIAAIVGRTGSGKSTLTELINKLLTPTSGEVLINDLINSKNNKIKGKQLQIFRKDIGFLFQFSENQLFEDTVIKDVMFGVKNFYPKEKNALSLAKKALNLVGLDESFYNRSPFSLSGGEKKKVAIAGVLAYAPKLLILDEPTAGLDAKGKREIMELFKKIHQSGVAIILVTHDMDVVFNYADKMIIIDDGEIKKIGSPKEILNEDIEPYHLATPNLYKAIHLLNKKGITLNSNNIFDIPSLLEALKHHG